MTVPGPRVGTGRLKNYKVSRGGPVAGVFEFAFDVLMSLPKGKTTGKGPGFPRGIWFPL